MLFDFDRVKLKVPKLYALYNQLDPRHIYKECYFERFKNDPDTLWNLTTSLTNGQNVFIKKSQLHKRE